MACLDENAFAAYFDLRLSPAETAALFAHVDGCRSCAELFEQCAREASTGRSLGTGPRPPGPLAPALAAQATLGRYRIEGILGVGGMGVVYAAWDPQLARRVAIKLLRPDAPGDTPQQRARMVREAQAMARLSHPNVVNVFEVDSRGEQLFVVMELIEGTTLTDWLREEERGWREIVRVFLAAGQGLLAAHRAGVVHRDFKPDNVLVSSEGRVCVTDFGVARLGAPEAQDGAAPAGAGAELLSTRSGVLVGTPAFMSPEQLRGEATDARSDLFSFCVALWAALHGVRPFPGKSVAELRAAMEAGRLEPGPRGEVPSFLRRALEQGLAADPARRPASMQELLTALSHDPARRRSRLLVAAVIGLLVAALGLTARHARLQDRLCQDQEKQLVGVWDGPRREAVRAALLRGGLAGAQESAAQVIRALDRYTAGWVQARQGICEATRRRGDQSEALLGLRMQCLDDRLDEARALIEALAGPGAPPLERASAASQALPSFADCATAAAASTPALPEAPAAREELATLRRRLDDGKAAFRLGREPEALAATQALLGDGALAAHPALRADVLRQQAEELLTLDRAEEGAATYREAALLGLRSHGDRGAALAFTRLAFVTGVQLHNTEAALELDALAAALIERLGNPPELQVKRLCGLALIHDKASQWPKAEAAARECMALAERTFPAGDADLVQALDALASVLANEGKYEESVKLSLRLLEIAEANGSGETIAMANQLYDLALTYQNMDRIDEEEALLRRALAIYKARLAPGTPALFTAQALLANAQYEHGRLDEAQALVDEALPQARGSPTVPIIEVELLWLSGQIQAKRARYDAAVALYRQAMAHPAVDGDLGEIRFSLAQALWDSGRDRKRALALAAQARDELPTHPNTVKGIDGWLAARRR